MDRFSTSPQYGDSKGFALQCQHCSNIVPCSPSAESVVCSACSEWHVCAVCGTQRQGKEFANVSENEVCMACEDEQVAEMERMKVLYDAKKVATIQMQNSPKKK